MHWTSRISIPIISVNLSQIPPASALHVHIPERSPRFRYVCYVQRGATVTGQPCTTKTSGEHNNTTHTDGPPLAAADTLQLAAWRHNGATWRRNGRVTGITCWSVLNYIRVLTHVAMTISEDSFGRCEFERSVALRIREPRFKSCV